MFLFTGFALLPVEIYGGSALFFVYQTMKNPPLPTLFFFYIVAAVVAVLLGEEGGGRKRREKGISSYGRFLLAVNFLAWGSPV